MYGLQQFLRPIALVLLFISCSKSDKNTENKTSGCTLASLSELYDGAVTRSFFYTHDDEGRVSRVDFDTRNSATYETYTYSPDKIVVSGTALAGGTSVYELDANGRVVKTDR